MFLLLFQSLRIFNTADNQQQMLDPAEVLLVSSWKKSLIQITIQSSKTRFSIQVLFVPKKII